MLHWAMFLAITSHFRRLVPQTVVTQVAGQTVQYVILQNSLQRCVRRCRRFCNLSRDVFGHSKECYTGQCFMELISPRPAFRDKLHGKMHSVIAPIGQRNTPASENPACDKQIPLTFFSPIPTADRERSITLVSPK